MMKAGLIAGTLMFLIVSSTSFWGLVPFPVFLLASFGAGFMTGVFEKTPQNTSRRGARAAVIAFGVGIAEWIMKGVIRIFIDNQTRAGLLSLFYDSTAVGLLPLILGALFIASIVLGLLCSWLGSAGGAIWNKTMGRSLVPPPDTNK